MPVCTVEEFISTSLAATAGREHLWFRGEPADTPTPLLPKLYRRPHNENKLLQTFRQRAPVSSSYCPEVKATDQWLFLVQHVGLPTRLLDWSESGLVGLFFALLCKNPVVWIIDPFELNG